MKLYRIIFDIFLYESVCILFFGGVLYLMQDPIAYILITGSIVLFSIACILRIAGFLLNLFEEDDPYWNM